MTVALFILWIFFPGEGFNLMKRTQHYGIYLSLLQQVLVPSSGHITSPVLYYSIVYIFLFIEPVVGFLKIYMEYMESLMSLIGQNYLVWPTKLLDTRCFSVL